MAHTKNYPPRVKIAGEDRDKKYPNRKLESLANKINYLEERVRLQLETRSLTTEIPHVEKLNRNIRMIQNEISMLKYCRRVILLYVEHNVPGETRIILTDAERDVLGLALRAFEMKNSPVDLVELRKKIEADVIPRGY